MLIILLCSIALYGAQFRIGYGNAAMSDYSKKDTNIAMAVWLEEAMKGTQYTASFEMYDLSQRLADDFKNDKVDLVVSYGLEFVKYYNKEDLIDGISGGMLNRAEENIVIVLPKDKTMEDFLALKKPTVSVQFSEDISKLYIKYLFLKNKKHENINFLNTKKRQGTLLKLFFHQADAAVVSQKTFNFAKELNPQIGKKLKIVLKTDIPLGNFGFFRKGFDEKLRVELINQAFQIGKTARGEQVFTMFKSEGIVKSSVKELAPIEKLYTDYKRLKNENK